MLAGGPAERLQALLVGGYFGAWLPAEAAWPVPMTHAGLRAAGGALGAGIVIALPASACALAETARVVRYLAEESAGQCGPCLFGLPALADALADLAYSRRPGRGDRRHRGAAAAGRAARRLPAPGRGHPAGAQRCSPRSPADARWHDGRGPVRGVRRAPAAAAARRRGKGLGLGMSVTLRVNPIACTGHGMCAELLPEIIELDPWGYPILLSPVDPALAAGPRQAGRAGLPRLALLVEETPGSTGDSLVVAAAPVSRWTRRRPAARRGRPDRTAPSSPTSRRIRRSPGPWRPARGSRRTS